MTEARHTPGPWLAASSASSVVGWPVVSQQGKPICDVMCVPHNFPNAEKHNAESAANAQLIAAAPDLLHAAQWALDHYNGKHMGANTVPLLEKAIAKAKGGAA